MTPADSVAVAAFLTALFADRRFIEIRMIEDRKGGALVHRRWFPTVEALVAALPELMVKAERTNAGVFYGVLPRLEGKGTAKDTLPSCVAWADLDNKDFSGGEAEARAGVARFVVPPSIVVRSAHGLHLYWLLNADADPAELSAASHAVAKVLGGDNTHDASRLLRVPGTFNRKDAANPILVEIEKLEPDARHALPALLAAAGAVHAARPKAAQGGSEGGMTDRVRRLVEKAKKVRDSFNGTGKPEFGKDGKPLDTSSSGYDYTLAVELAKAGVQDADEIATALTYRPDGHARGKGVDYAQRTANKALASLDSGGGTEADFTVDTVRKYDSRPARYELRIEGRTIQFSTPELLSPKSWLVSLTDALGRIPALPDKDDFGVFVNALLARAEIVTLPAEASDEQAGLEAIVDLVEDMHVGDDPKDLDDGRAYLLPDGPHAGCTAFKLTTLIALLREDFPALRRQDVTAYLRKLDAVDFQLPGSRRKRVWIIPSVRARGIEEASA